MLSFTGVSYAVGGRDILADLTLSVAPGELAVVIGASGVGKSTLLRLAAGLISPQTGWIDRRRRRLGMVFQEPRLAPWADARDNVALVLEGAGRSKAARRAVAEGWLTRLGLGPVEWGKRPSQLSGGMQARTAIARALAIEPDLLLLDEPFAALDPSLRRELQQLTRSAIDARAAALFVTHDLVEAVRLADRIIVLAGTPARIMVDQPHRPIADQADAWRAAADLLQRPEISAAFKGADPTKR